MNEMTYSKLTGLMINATSSATIVILLQVVKRDIYLLPQTYNDRMIMRNSEFYASNM